jgi:predicted secreted protein
MALVHGKGTVVSVDAADMSVYSTSCEFEIKSDEHDVTTFGQDFKVFAGGLKESTMKMEGFYDDSATGPRATLEDTVGTVVEIIYQPQGAGTGKPKRTFDGLIASYNEAAPVDDMIKFTLQVHGSGAVATTVT